MERWSDAVVLVGEWTETRRAFGGSGCHRGEDRSGRMFMVKLVKVRKWFDPL
jgi:hypothetical protein